MKERVIINNLIIVLGIILFMSTGKNKSYPQDYFKLPVKRDILLSGTFGELRPNHFHAGIDIKSKNGVSGESIYTSAKGYISRIKVQSGSYGNVIYVDHPNGYSTVYAHLSEFDPAIADYVQKKQYALKKFEVDLYPDPNQFPLEDGSYLGKMGNSGNSFGPHLHFEIRETASQIPVNPLLFGLPINDKVRPEIYQLAVYSINEKNEVIHTKVHDVKKKSAGEYTLPVDLSYGAWRVAFGIKSYDQMNGSYNRNGIYKLKMAVDEAPHYGFEMDAIPFSDTRYINAHMDYSLKQQNKGYVHRCFKLDGNLLNIYETNDGSGVIKLFKDKTQKIDIQLEDANENISKLTFNISRSENILPLESPVFHHNIKVGTKYEIRNTECEITFGESTFYQNTYLSYETGEEGGYSNTITVGDKTIPVHSRFSLKIKPKKVDPALEHKLYVAYKESKGKSMSLGGKWQDGFLETSTRLLGQYQIDIDTIGPKVQAISFSKNMAGRSKMSFKITDNVETSYPAKGLSYEAYIDGQWILMSYDGKRDLISHALLDDLEKGEHQFKLIVTDDRKNKTVYERVFTL